MALNRMTKNNRFSTSMSNSPVAIYDFLGVHRIKSKTEQEHVIVLDKLLNISKLSAIFVLHYNIDLQVQGEETYKKSDWSKTSCELYDK